MSQFLYFVLSLAVNRVAEAASGSARNLSGIPCGQPGGGSPFRQGRIMGGTAADILEFPYAVSLRNNNNEHYCAGSLIHRSYVVTAAHCLDHATPSLLVAGDQNTVVVDSKNEQRLHAEKIIKHPNWNHQGIGINDIAIIKLQVPVEWKENVQPVCLPGPIEYLKEGTLGYLAGWGSDHYYQNPTEELHSVQLPIISEDECKKSVQSTAKFTDAHLCAGHTDAGKDGCRADSGSGLITNVAGNMILSGIMSGGVKCGGPGIYTRVLKFVQWIDEVIKDEETAQENLRKKREARHARLQLEL